MRKEVLDVYPGNIRTGLLEHVSREQVIAMMSICRILSNMW